MIRVIQCRVRVCTARDGIFLFVALLGILIHAFDKFSEIRDAIEKLLRSLPKHIRSATFERPVLLRDRKLVCGAVGFLYRCGGEIVICSRPERVNIEADLPFDCKETAMRHVVAFPTTDATFVRAAVAYGDCNAVIRRAGNDRDRDFQLRAIGFNREPRSVFKIKQAVLFLRAEAELLSGRRTDDCCVVPSDFRNWIRQLLNPCVIRKPSIVHLRTRGENDFHAFGWSNVFCSDFLRRHRIECDWLSRSGSRHEPIVQKLRPGYRVDSACDFFERFLNQFESFGFFFRKDEVEQLNLRPSTEERKNHRLL